VDPDDPTVAAAKNRARYFTFSLRGYGPHSNHACKVARTSSQGLADFNASLLGDHRSIHHVHPLDDRTEQSGEHCLCDRLYIMLGDFSEIFDRYFAEIVTKDLT